MGIGIRVVLVQESNGTGNLHWYNSKHNLSQYFFLTSLSVTSLLLLPSNSILFSILHHNLTLLFDKMHDGYYEFHKRNHTSVYTVILECIHISFTQKYVHQ